LVARQFSSAGPAVDAYAATPTTIAQRILLAFALQKRWKCFALDVVTAFLNAPIEEDKWIVVRLMKCPFEPKLWEDYQLMRCKKALYGLRESPRLFQTWIAGKLREMNWTRCISDPQLFALMMGGELRSLISMHADDMLVAMPDLDRMEFLAKLRDKVKVTEGPVLSDAWEPFLGRQFRITTSEGRPCIDIRMPPRYLEQILEEMGLQGLRALRRVQTPMVKGAEMVKGEGDPLTEKEKRRYQRILGMLMWLRQERADMAFAVKEAARRVSNPTASCMELLKRIGRYLQATPDLLLRLQCDASLPSEILVYCDSNWGSSFDRRSTTGVAIFWCEVLLMTLCRTQPTISTSSMEAELIAIHSAIAEAKLACTILKELGQETSIRVRSDSWAAVNSAYAKGLQRTKHLDIKYLKVQEWVREGTIVEHLSATLNFSDIFTKPLPPQLFQAFRGALGFVDNTVVESLDVDMIVCVRQEDNLGRGGEGERRLGRCGRVGLMTALQKSLRSVRCVLWFCLEPTPVACAEIEGDSNEVLFWLNFCCWLVGATVILYLMGCGIWKLVLLVRPRPLVATAQRRGTGRDAGHDLYLTWKKSQ
jgi:hypothetical protein